MDNALQPLQEEHKAFLPQIAALKETADMVQNEPMATVFEHLEDNYAFLYDTLRIHALAEEEVLYKEVARIAPDIPIPGMLQEHKTIMELTAELSTIIAGYKAGNTVEASRLQDVLLGLHSLISKHFQAEETELLPVIATHMSPQEIVNMIQDMEAAASAHRV